MSMYAHPLPDGSTILVPLGTTYEQAEAIAQKQRPDAYKQAAPKGGRGNMLGDVAGSVVSGIGGLASLPGQIGTVAGIAKPDNVVTQFGEGIQEFGRSLQSDKLKEQQLKLQLAQQEAEKNGFSAEVAAALKQYASNPYLTLNALIEQLPQLAVSFGAGKAAQLGTKALLPNVTEKGLQTAAVAGASGSGAVMQGADVGAETYDRVYKAAIRLGLPEEVAKARALEEARKAALKAGALSAATMAVLPGAEKALLGAQPARGMLRGAARTGAGEATQEAVEEGGGAIFAGQGEQAVDPSVNPMTGAGFRAGQGAVLGAGLGVGAGGFQGAAVARDERQKSLAMEQQETQARREREAQERAAEEARKKDPKYLMELEQQYQQSQAELADLRAQEKAIVKPAQGSAEAVQKGELRQAVREKEAEIEPLAREYNSRRLELERAKEEARVAGLTPQQYFFEQYGISADQQQDTSGVFLGDTPTEAKPQETYAEQRMRFANPLAEPTVKDAVDALMQDREQAAAFVKSGEQVPGFGRQDSEAVRSAIKLQLKEIDKGEQRAVKEELAQRQQDLQTAATPPDTKDPLEMLNAALAEDEAQREEKGLPDWYFDQLFDNAVTSADSAKEESAVSIPDGVRPRANPSRLLKALDTLFSTQEQAEAEGSNAARAANPEASRAAQQRREQATQTLLELQRDPSKLPSALRAVTGTPEEGQTDVPLDEAESRFVQEVIGSRKEQDEVLQNVASLVQDLRTGNVLNSSGEAAKARVAKYEQEVKRLQDARTKIRSSIQQGGGQFANADNVVALNNIEAKIAEAQSELERAQVEAENTQGGAGAASSTYGTLRNQLTRLRKQFINAAIREAATVRAGYGKQLPKTEALQAAEELNKVFNEWVTRSAALPVREMRAFDPQEDPARQQWTKGQKQEYVKAALRKALVDKIGAARVASIEAGNPQQRGAETTLSPDETRSITAKAEQDFDAGLRAAGPRAARFQIRGTEVVKSDEGKAIPVDPRPQEERDLRAYKAAEAVYKQQIRQITSNLAGVKDTGQRVEPGIKMQFAESEAAKTAEARGETAKTRGGELRRRREYVSNLISRALQNPRISFRVRQALEAAQGAIEEGKGLQTDVVGGSEVATDAPRFAPGLLDAAEELANRVLTGRGTRTGDNEEKLIRDIKDGIRGVAEPDEAQQDLFGDEAPKRRESDAATRVADIESQIVALEGTKSTSLKEGAERAKKLTELRTSLGKARKEAAQAKDDRKGITKERERLQGDLGFFRASARNFEKAPQVVAGRKAAADNKELVNLLDKAIAAKEQKQGKYLSALEEMASKKQVALGKQLEMLRSAMQDAAKKAIEEAKNQDWAKPFLSRIEAAQDAIAGAETWLDALEKEWADKTKALKGKEPTGEDVAAASDMDAANDADVAQDRIADERIKLNVEMRQKIDAEKARLERGKEELASATKELNEALNKPEAIRQSVNDKLVVFEKLNLDYLVNQLREQGFIVDPEAGTVRTTAGLPKAEAQQQLDAQRVALTKAREAAAEKNIQRKTDLQRRLDAIQTGLGLPGKRRVAGRTETVKSAQELKQEREAREREQAAAQTEEAKRKKQNLQDAIDRNTDEIQRLEKADKEAPDPKRQRQIRKLRGESRRMQRQLDVATAPADSPLIVKPKPAVREDTRAPRTMRGSETTRQEELTRVQKEKDREDRKDAKTGRISAKYSKTLRDAVEAMRREKDGPVNDADLEADTDISDFGGQDKFFSGRVNFRPVRMEELRAARKHKLQGASFKDAGEWLLGQIKSPFQKALVGKVLQVLEKTDGKIVFEESLDNGSSGEFQPGENRIVFSAAALRNQDTFKEVLLHELVHVGTVSGLMADDKLRAEVYKLMQRVKAWTKSVEGKQYLKQNPNALDYNPDTDKFDRVYGTTDVFEFVADTFSNPAFQLMLKQIPSDEKGFFRSVYDSFINAIARMFGASKPAELNTLADALAATEQALSATWMEFETNKFNTNATFAAPRREYKDSTIGTAADVMIGKDRSKLAQIREEANGLHFRVRFVDSNAALKKAVEKGDPVMAMQVNYDLMNFAQRNHFVQQAIMNGAPTREWWSREGNRDVYKTEVKDGPSLKRVAELLGKVEGYGNSQAVSDTFTLLALAKRAQTRGWDRVFGDVKADTPGADAENKRRQDARDRADALAKELDAGKSPFAEAYKEYQGFNKGMLQFAQQAGVISKDEFRRLAREQNYTPLFRKDQNGNMVMEIDQGRDITVGRLKDEPHLNKLLGSDGQVMDFFTASVRSASILVDASLHNIASREAAFTLQALGAARPANRTEKSENIIEFRKDGQEDSQRFVIDTDAIGVPTELVVKGFAGVPASLPGIIRMAGVPATILRKAVTRNPLYMVRQLIRDPVSAWLATGAEFNPITDTFKEVNKALKGTEDKTLDRRGITGGVIYSDDPADIERIRDMAMSAGSKGFGYVMAKLDEMAIAADAATRRNVYNGAVKEGASEIQATLAAYEAMPFSKRGTAPSVRMLNHMVPFLSAAIQGWDVLYRSAIKNDMPLSDRLDVRKKLLQRGMLIAGMTVLYAMAVADDEEYQKANTTERLNNWFVRLPGTEQTLKLPIPFEFGVVFKMLPEALIRGAAEDKELGKELRAVGGALVDMVPNVMVPQAVLPAVEALLNKSFYTGSPIEGRDLQGLDLAERFDTKTTELSKLFGMDFEVFGKQFGVSPKMFEYLASQYTAGIYPAIAGLIDTILPAPTAEKPDRKLAELPLFRSALVQEDAGGEVNRLYDEIEKFTRYTNTFKRLAETDPTRAMEYAQENREELGKGAVAAKAKAALDKFSNLQRKIERDLQMDGKQKQAALENIKRLKSQLAAQFSAAL